MRFKKGVKIFGLRTEMLAALSAIEAAYEKAGVDCVVTSCVEGQHSTTSLHYTGCALDLRTRDLPPSMHKALADDIRIRLTDEFDVVLEATHIHVEFQPKRPRKSPKRTQVA